MADYFGSNDRGERELARHLLAFAAGVVPPPASDCIENDEPDDFDRNVAVIAAYMAQLALSLPMLATVAYGLEPCADASWGKLAEELRQGHPSLSDLHFAGVVSTTVEAIRHLALTMPAGSYLDSSARLKIFAMGLDVVPEHREAIRALLIHDIDALLGDQQPTYRWLVDRVAPPTGRRTNFAKSRASEPGQPVDRDDLGSNRAQRLIVH